MEAEIGLFEVLRLICREARQVAARKAVLDLDADEERLGEIHPVPRGEGADLLLGGLEKSKRRRRLGTVRAVDLLLELAGRVILGLLPVPEREERLRERRADVRIGQVQSPENPDGVLVWSLADR